MTKATLSRDNLSAKVLSGIRQHLGCEAVKEVSISEVAEIDAISSWRVTVIDSGGVPIIQANHAALHAQNALRHRFDLQTDYRTMNRLGLKPALGVSSNSVPPVFPPCPTCSKEMRFISISPTCRGPPHLGNPSIPSLGAQMQQKFVWLVGSGESFLDVAIDGLMAVIGASLLTQLVHLTFDAL